MADETRNIHNQEQLVVCICWVNKPYKVCEDPVGLVSIPKTDAASILMALKDTLIRCGFPLELCRGQGYDGASSMMGHLNGAAVQIQREVPAALPIHCLAHYLNLVLEEAGKKVTPIRDALDLVHEVARLIRWSPKREASFLEEQLHAAVGGWL